MQPKNSKDILASLFGLPDLSALPYPTAPQPPSPPEPPRAFDPVHVVEEKPALSKGLFWDLFGGQPDALAQDVINHPERYSEELVRLARDLVERRRQVDQLSACERALLNTGSIEFYQYRPPMPEKTKTPASPPRSRHVEPVEPPAAPEPGVDVPGESALRPYWWV